MMDGYETIEQAADRLGVSGSLVRRWCRDGKISCVKVTERAWLVTKGAEPKAVRRFRV